MHDGQNVVNPATANFGVDWGVDEVLDGLVREGAMPRTAVLAVACTDERSSDYGPGPAGVTYVAWLAEELVPFVQSSQGMAQDLPVTVAGASMGGLISFIAAERHPEVFSSAMCMSPAFAYNGFSYVDSLRARSWSGNRVPMWIDNGTVGLETQLQTGVDDMGAYLDSLQQTFTVRSYHGARHFESDWGARFGEALLWLTTHELAHHEGRQSAP
jgi:enterochelin esterase-like enzyme